MDEYTADAFANRDEPVPLLTVTYSDAEASSSEAEKEGKTQKLKRSLSPARLKEKAQDLKESHAEKIEQAPPGSLSIQDRLFARLLQQVIPTEDVDRHPDTPIDRRSSEYVRRPAFSLPLMTNNFRKFNARIGIVFVFQNRLIRLFTWRTTTHTLSFLAVYTFVCLDPYLIVVLPLITALLFVMVPAFVVRHPPPPPSTSTSSTTPYSEYTYSGPALAPARTIRPAAETSKDFFRNMRDLQNSMADFANLHDLLVHFVAPATNFSNEIRSSTLFLYLTVLTTVLFISAHLFPWRFICLVAGYTLTLSGHPTMQSWLVKFESRAKKKAADLINPPSASTGKPPPSWLGITPQSVVSTLESASTITLSTAPETREVEIFELQHRPLSSQQGSSAGEWTHHLFTPQPYDPLSPSRIAGDRSRGTRSFEDVQPPDGWAWKDKKWTLDLEAGEWVSERLIVGVGFDDIHASGLDDGGNVGAAAAESGKTEEREGDFGGWVWDLPPAYGKTRDEEVWLAYGDYEVPTTREKEKEKKKGQKKKGGASDKDWEEIIRYDSGGKTGEWRRRRWVRIVQRVGVEGVGGGDGG